MLTALKKEDWKYFANKELENINTQIEDLNTLIAQDSENEDLKTQLKSLELQKEVVNLRLDKNINCMLFFRYGRVWRQSGRKWRNRLWHK